MPTKEDLLNSLTVKQLKELARENKISLVLEGWLWESKATNKDEIIEVLLDSSKITKKKILAKLTSKTALRSESKKKTSRKTATRKKSSSKRRALTTYEKESVLKGQDYRCARCGTDLSRMVPNFDHRKPLALGGEDELYNIQALCANCHAEKTREDRHKISRLGS